MPIRWDRPRRLWAQSKVVISSAVSRACETRQWQLWFRHQCRTRARFRASHGAREWRSHSSNPNDEDKARAYGCVGLFRYPGQQTPPSAACSAAAVCPDTRGLQEWTWSCTHSLHGLGGECSTMSSERAFIIEACPAQAYRRRRGNCSQATPATQSAGCRSHRSPSCSRVVAAVDRTLNPSPSPAQHQGARQSR
jgi:hypothetical protein